MSQSTAVAGAPARGWIGRFYQSTIGKKVVMAVTGVVLIGFLIVHVIGNLLVYAGPETYNHYSAVLKGNLVLLWGVRTILLVSLLLHVHSAWGLTLLSRAARPARYAEVTHRASTLASRMMRIGGVVLLVFIVFHLLHFTTGTFHPSFADGDVFGNVVRGFQVTPVALFYVVAMVALMLHLRHGVWSFFQTLGLNHPHVNGIRRGLAWLLALLIGVGFISIPLAVLFRLVR